MCVVEFSLSEAVATVFWQNNCIQQTNRRLETHCEAVQTQALRVNAKGVMGKSRKQYAMESAVVRVKNHKMFLISVNYFAPLNKDISILDFPPRSMMYTKKTLLSRRS